MNPDFRKINSSEAELDRCLSEMLKTSLPDARENPWFTRRVMHRLPEKNRFAGLSIWQWVCYLLGGIAYVVAIVLAGKWLSLSGFSETSLLAVAAMSLLILGCGGVLLVPQLIRIVKEP